MYARLTRTTPAKAVVLAAVAVAVWGFVAFEALSLTAAQGL